MAAQPAPEGPLTHDQPASGLPWTPEDQRWPLARRFREVAKAFPSNVAITDNDEQLTYEELSDRAERIAVVISERSGDDPVALLFEHEISMVTAICGSWLAQTPYVALDATYPMPSLEHVVAVAGSSLILTSRRHENLARTLAGETATVVDIDALPDPAGPVVPSYEALDPSAISGLFFTSGSTGAPKGVMRAERYMLYRSAWEAERVPFGPDDRLACMRPFVHGASTTSLTNALLNGGTLALYRPRERGAHELSRWLHEQRVTQMDIPVMLLRAWVEGAQGETFPSVRNVGVASGQTLWSDVIAIRSLIPQCRVRTGYSSAETGFVARLIIDPSTHLTDRVVPVGDLFDETSIDLVDRVGNPVAEGEAGEAIVTSPHLALGYWRNPEATAAVFWADPDDPSKRSFRTGDLLRWNEGGRLEFVDREDSRARVRGHRVSPDYVAAALSDREEVVDAAVVVNRHSGSDRLVAYFVPSSAHASTPGDVRRSLASELPHYMIPSELIALDELPVLPNGKLDRSRLEHVAGERSPGTDAAGEWADELEEQIAAMWTDVLGISGFGPDAGWLDLGGDSLSAMRVAGRIAQRWGTTSTVQLLLESATVSQIAKAVTASSGGDTTADAGPTPIIALDPAAPAPLSYGQEAVWLDELLSENRTRYVMPRAITLEGPLDVGALEEALRFLVRRHEVMRSAVRFDGDEAHTHLLPADFELAVEDVRAMPPSDVIIAEEAQRPFDLASQLLYRGRLFRSGANHHTLALTHHHLASDRTSSRVVLEELAEAYRQLASGGTPQLRPLSTQYRDFAAWERSWLSDATLEPHLAYWKGVLGQRHPSAVLSGAGDPRADTSDHSIVLTPSQWRALSVHTRQEGVTPFVGFLGVLALALSSITEGSDLVVGTTVSRRNRPELERMVGYLVDLLPIVLPTAPERSWRSAMQAAGRAAASAFEHRDAPFSQIVRAVGGPRTGGRRPLIDLNLNWDDLGRARPTFGEARIAHIQSRGQPSRVATSVAVRRAGNHVSCTISFGASLAGTPVAGRLTSLLERAVRTVEHPDEAWHPDD